jgi:peptide/nickel transport system permease protein
MFVYLIRKFLLTLSIIFGVMLLTFLLFNFVAKNPALAFAGKAATAAQIEAIRHKMGLDKSKLLQFWDIMTFRFPESMRYQESVWKLFAAKAPVSLAIQGPAFVIGLGLQFAVAIIVASRRNSLLDYSATVLAVLLMSIPALSIYLGVQWLFGVKLQWFPIAGWAPGFLFAIHFAALPILVSVSGSLGGGVRFYRTVALEEINTDYVRTARAKGVSGGDVLLIHVFRNMLIPVVTQTIVAIPFLVTGSLVLESMFQIPGFGGLLVDSIHATDSPVVMAVIYLTSIAYALMLFATDICYTLVDPRVTLR